MSAGHSDAAAELLEVVPAGSDPETSGLSAFTRDDLVRICEERFGKRFWTRKKFKGARALKSKISPTRVPIEKKESFRWLQNLEQSTALLAAPDRCVHVGDRESDIYELYCKAHELGTHFVVRTCVDRLTGD
jgi:hypothetical protein